MKRSESGDDSRGASLDPDRNSGADKAPRGGNGRRLVALQLTREEAARVMELRRLRTFEASSIPGAEVSNILETVGEKLMGIDLLIKDLANEACRHDRRTCHKLWAVHLALDGVIKDTSSPLDWVSGETKAIAGMDDGEI